MFSRHRWMGRSCRASHARRVSPSRLIMRFMTASCPGLLPVSRPREHAYTPPNVPLRYTTSSAGPRTVPSSRCSALERLRSSLGYAASGSRGGTCCHRGTPRTSTGLVPSGGRSERKFWRSRRAGRSTRDGGSCVSSVGCHHEKKASETNMVL